MVFLSFPDELRQFVFRLGVWGHQREDLLSLFCPKVALLSLSVSKSC